MRHHDIGVTLDDRDGSRLRDFSFGKIQAKEATALIEERRFRAVQILGGILRAGHDTTAEGDNPTLFVTNRKNDSIAERVVIAVAVFSWLNEASQGHVA